MNKKLNKEEVSGENYIPYIPANKEIKELYLGGVLKQILLIYLVIIVILLIQQEQDVYEQ